MRRENTEQLALTGQQRRGLHGPHAGVQQHLQGGRAREQGTVLHVFDDHALPAPKGLATNRSAVLDMPEELQKGPFMAMLGNDTQGAAFQQLQGAALGPQNGDGCVHDLLKKGFEPARFQDSCAQRMEPQKSRQICLKRARRTGIVLSGHKTATEFPGRRRLPPGQALPILLRVP